MPYKNPQDQKESWKKWSQKHRNEYRKRKAIQSLAIVNNRIRKKCSIKKCKELGERHHPDYCKPKDIIWLCKKHHCQIHRLPERLCSIKGCNRIHRARGYCVNHYWQHFTKKALTLAQNKKARTE